MAGGFPATDSRHAESEPVTEETPIQPAGDGLPTAEDLDAHVEQTVPAEEPVVLTEDGEEAEPVVEEEHPE